MGSAVTALGPAADLLDRLFYNDISTSFDEETLSIWASLILDGQIGFELPGGFAIKIGEGDGVTPLIVGMRISPAGVAIAVEELAVVLSIPDSLLRPAPPAGGGETPERVELVLEGALILDESLNLRVEGFESVSLPRSFVGSSSVVISADDVCDRHQARPHVRSGKDRAARGHARARARRARAHPRSDRAFRREWTPGGTVHAGVRRRSQAFCRSGQRRARRRPVRL